MSVNNTDLNLSVEDIKRNERNANRRNKYANDAEFKKKKLEKDKQYQKENKDKVKIWQSNFRSTHRLEYNEYKRNYYHTVIKPKKKLEKENIISV
jgi:hypothetical protein